MFPENLDWVALPVEKIALVSLEVTQARLDEALRYVRERNILHRILLLHVRCRKKRLSQKKSLTYDA